MKDIYQFSRDQGLTTAQIDRKLGLSEQTVKNTLSTALAKIREYLVARGVRVPVAVIGMMVW